MSNDIFYSTVMVLEQRSYLGHIKPTTMTTTFNVKFYMPHATAVISSLGYLVVILFS